MITTNHILYGLPPFLSGILILGFGLIIYKSNPALVRNRAMSIMCLGATIWLCSYAINYFFPKSPILNIFLSKFSYIGVTIIWVAYLHFTVSFLGIKANRLLIFTYIFAFVLAVLTLFTNLIVCDNYHYFWGPYPKAAKLHPLHLLYAGYVWLYCLWHL